MSKCALSAVVRPIFPRRFESTQGHFRFYFFWSYLRYVYKGRCCKNYNISFYHWANSIVWRAILFSIFHRHMSFFIILKIRQAQREWDSLFEIDDTMIPKRLLTPSIAQKVLFIGKAGRVLNRSKRWTARLDDSCGEQLTAPTLQWCPPQRTGCKIA